MKMVPSSFFPLVSIVTIPCLGLVSDSRVARIVDSENTVSPTKTGATNLILSHPKLAIALKLVVHTLNPQTMERVTKLETSGRPNSVSFQYR